MPNLYRIDDIECPSYVVARDWNEALSKWRRHTIEGGWHGTQSEDAQVPEPESIHLVCSDLDGCPHGDPGGSAVLLT